MKIRITDIPAEGLKVQDTLPLEELNSRMNEGSNTEFNFLSAPLVKLEVHRAGEGAEVEGSVSAEFSQGCSLCLDSLPRSSVVPVSFQLRQRKGERGEEDDIGMIYYDGDSVDLQEAIEECLILSLSLFWHPEFIEDKCTQCKRSRKDLGLGKPNEKLTLGNLIQQASKKK